MNIENAKSLYENRKRQVNPLENSKSNNYWGKPFLQISKTPSLSIIKVSPFYKDIKIWIVSIIEVSRNIWTFNFFNVNVVALNNLHVVYTSANGVPPTY